MKKGEGHAQELFQRGFRYVSGKNGVEQDVAEAARWFRQAAALGHVEAFYNLGVCFYKGAGVNKDLAEAAQWYQKAADKGHAGAQYNLGCCYVKGEGVNQDLLMGALLYQQAADGGLEQARFALSQLRKESRWKEQDTRKGRELALVSRKHKKEFCGWCVGLLRKNWWCSGCRAVAYCNADCQLKAWPKHKKECRNICDHRIRWGKIGGYKMLFKIWFEVWFLVQYLLLESTKPKKTTLQLATLLCCVS